MLPLSRCNQAVASLSSLLGCWPYLLIGAPLPADPPVCRRHSRLSAPAARHNDAARGGAALPRGRGVLAAASGGAGRPGRHLSGPAGTGPGRTGSSDRRHRPVRALKVSNEGRPAGSCCAAGPGSSISNGMTRMSSECPFLCTGCAQQVRRRRPGLQELLLVCMQAGLLAGDVLQPAAKQLASCCGVSQTLVQFYFVPAPSLHQLAAC